MKIKFIFAAILVYCNNIITQDVNPAYTMAMQNTLFQRPKTTPAEVNPADIMSKQETLFKRPTKNQKVILQPVQPTIKVPAQTEEKSQQISKTQAAYSKPKNLKAENDIEAQISKNKKTQVVSSTLSSVKKLDWQTISKKTNLEKNRDLLSLNRSIRKNNKSDERQKEFIVIDDKLLPDFKLAKLKTINLFADLPIVGAFTKNKKNDLMHRSRLAIIPMNNDMLKKVLPKDIEMNLAKKLNISTNKLFDHLKSINTKFMSLAFGRLVDNNKPVSDNKYLVNNIMYHSITNPIIENLNKNSDKVRYLGTKIETYIYNPNGIKLFSQELPGRKIFNPSDRIISNQELPIKKNISYHKSFADLSENETTKIELLNKREFSKFWLITISEDKKFINISNILLANTQNAEELLIRAFNEADTIEQLEIKLNNEINEAHWLPREDKEALKNWIETVIKASI